MKFFQPSFCSLVADVPSFISMPRMACCWPHLVRVRVGVRVRVKVRVRINVSGQG